MYHKNQKTTAVIVLVLVMALFISACGSAESDVVEQEEEQENGEQENSEQGTEEQRKNMLGPMQSMIYAHLDAALDEEITPHWTADETVWGPIDELINDWGETYAEEGDGVQTDGERSLLVSDDFLKECASALYEDFDGILPEIPASLTTSGYGVSAKEDGDFRFSTNTWGEQNWECRIHSWTEHPDGSQTVEVERYSSGGTLDDTYQFELVGNPYADRQEDPFFAYSVSSMVKINDGEPTDDQYILPESDIRYYSEEEITALDDWDINMARLEIYARHGRIFNTYPYFDYKTWYQGMVKPEDFNDNVLNEYERENIKTISIVGGLLGDEAITDSDEYFRESWDIIQEYGFYNYAHLYSDETEYPYSNLFFVLYPESVEDKGDYLFARALFYKPIMVPANLKPGDKITVTTDELEGTTEELTCIEEGGLAIGDSEYPSYSFEYTGEDNMTMLYEYDIYGRPSCAFYNGVLRIRKDALVGSTLRLQGYDAASRGLLIEGDSFFDGVSFDDDGYVTQLIYTGE